MTERFNEIIQQGLNNGYSDKHITGENPLVYRCNGSLHFEKSLQSNQR